MFSWPVCSLETAHSPLGVVIRPIHQVTWEAASFVWNLEQVKALQEVQAAIQLALLLGPYDPADPLLLVEDTDGVCSL